MREPIAKQRDPGSSCATWCVRLTSLSLICILFVAVANDPALFAIGILAAIPLLTAAMLLAFAARSRYRLGDMRESRFEMLVGGALSIILLVAALSMVGPAVRTSGIFSEQTRRSR